MVSYDDQTWFKSYFHSHTPKIDYIELTLTLYNYQYCQIMCMLHQISKRPWKILIIISRFEFNTFHSIENYLMPFTHSDMVHYLTHISCWAIEIDISRNSKYVWITKYGRFVFRYIEIIGGYMERIIGKYHIARL